MPSSTLLKFSSQGLTFFYHCLKLQGLKMLLILGCLDFECCFLELTV
jgi:hypothetical protein